MSQPIQWSEARTKAFTAEIERARRRRTQAKDTYDWDGNLARYVPLPKDANGHASTDVNVGADFRDVERKKAALFYDTPYVSFVPDAPSTVVAAPPPAASPDGSPPPPPLTLGTVVAWHQRLINGLLGHRYADAKARVHEVLFDLICPAGLGTISVGYDVATVPVERPVLDPMGQPVVNPLGVPETQQVQVPIHEEWYLARISPYALLLPADLKTSDIKAAPWVGYDFCLPVGEARRRFGLPAEWKPRSQGAGYEADERPYFKDEHLDAELTGEGREEVTGVVVEYRPALLAEEGDPPYHPAQLCELVLIDGEREPIRHRPSPHQTIGDDARMTPDSISTFTIQPLWTRSRTDQAYVASDMTVTGALTREINTYRTITVQQRDGNRIIMLYDPEKLNPDVRDKVKQGDVATWVPVEPGMLDGGVDKIMAQVTQLSQGRENWNGQDYIERDREQILGIGANQVGVQSRSARTATEVSATQRNTEARFEAERQSVLEWYIRCVCLFDTLVLRYADAATASKILGPEAGPAWAQYKGALAGAYAYQIQVDSGRYIDVESDKRQLMQLLNMVGQSQHVNVVPILKKLAHTFGMDPGEVVIDQPPKRAPDPPKVSLTFKGEDFNAGLPQFDIIIELAKQGGYQISPEAIEAAKLKASQQALLAMQTPAEPDTPVPGEPPQITQTLPRMNTLNSHQSEETGNRTGPAVS